MSRFQLYVAYSNAHNSNLQDVFMLHFVCRWLYIANDFMFSDDFIYVTSSYNVHHWVQVVNCGFRGTPPGTKTSESYMSHSQMSTSFSSISILSLFIRFNVEYICNIQMDCAFTRYWQFLDIILLLSSKHHLFWECNPCTRSNANWSPMCICFSGLPADFTSMQILQVWLCTCSLGVAPTAITTLLLPDLT